MRQPSWSVSDMICRRGDLSLAFRFPLLSMGRDLVRIPVTSLATVCWGAGGVFLLFSLGSGGASVGPDAATVGAREHSAGWVWAFCSEELEREKKMGTGQ